MTLDLSDSVQQLQELDPQALRSQAKHWREKARRCTDLAGSSVTQEGRDTLAAMALDFDSKAEQVEAALVTIQRVYRERAFLDS